MRGALTAGVPVAVTPVALFDELGDAVHRFRGIEVEEVAAGLDRLLDSQELRVALQDRARDWVSDRQWPGIGQRLQGMLTGLVRTRRLG